MNDVTYVIATPEERKLLPEGATYIETGVGGLNVIKALSHLDRKTRLHNIGYAGSNFFSVGTKVRIGYLKAYHPGVRYREPVFCLDGDTPCYTAGDFVKNTDIKVPCVFDMELAYIAAMGFARLTAEKVVSDNLSLSEYNRTVRNT